MTVLLGYVPTELGDLALERAIWESEARSCRLLVINAARGDAAVERNRLDEAARERLIARLDQAGVDYRLEEVVRLEEPDHIILDYADKNDASLLVIGLRNRSPVGKLIMGSTARRILVHAFCDVLAVKPNSQ